VTDDGDGMLTLATIDIDDFKIVNDLHGHPIGDEALRRVAEALRRAVRNQDSVFRVGGEEFAVLLPGLTASDALPVAERLRAAVAAIPFALPLRISIGLASWPADASDRDALLERADDALYSAKHAGTDRTSVASGARRDAAGDGGSWTGLLHMLRGKEGGTLAHSAEVAALCVEVGRELGLEGERLAELRIAGQLHDIGKVAVPDAILQKPGPLDEDELRLAQMHPVTGAELARAWGLERPARFVLEHHEHIDGSGYPAGLTGDEITLEARILHTVDAFASMTRDRPYRAAMSVEDALDELRRFSGKHFDPESVATTVAVVRAARAGRGAGQTGLVA
jgi:two-component system cell cycle response regulator